MPEVSELKALRHVVASRPKCLCVSCVLSGCILHAYRIIQGCEHAKGRLGVSRDRHTDDQTRREAAEDIRVEVMEAMFESAHIHSVAVFALWSGLLTPDTPCVANTPPHPTSERKC